MRFASPDRGACVIDADNAAWLRLALVPGLGPAAFLRLLQTLGSPQQILQASPVELAAHLPASLVRSVQQQAQQPLPPQWQDWLQQPGNRLLSLADTDYPAQLLHIDLPPPVLFLSGRAELLQRPLFAIVGSRQASAAGLRHARRFAAALSEAGLCIVSGMAAGIDSAAHAAALAAPGSSIALIGTGLDRVYPASNRALAQQLASEGLLISEFPLGTPPRAENFPRRNRLISGLARGCLVVEATTRSGSLITARLAAEQGRDVFAIPGSIDAPQSRGCHQLIKQGAALVDQVDDILEALGWTGPRPANTGAAQEGVATVALPPWLQQLGFEPFDVDEASTLSGLTAGEVCAILMQMEMAGVLGSAGAGRFQRMA